MSRGRQISRLRLKPPTPDAQAQYLLEWSAKALRGGLQDFPQLTSEALFGNDLPLEVEIGPGTGEYLCDLAGRHEGRNYLGIEASRKAVYYAVNAAAERGLANLRFIRANVKLLYPLMVSESWAGVYLHFPDPVHKRKDEKRRVFDQAFLDRMADVLAPGGQISVVSDNEGFFAEMLALAEGERRFRFVEGARGGVEFQPEQKSRFQLFWEGKGVRARRFLIERV